MLVEVGHGDHVAIHRDGYVACNIALPGEEFRLPNSPAHVEISVLRPDDLLNLEIVAVNLRLDTTDAENPVLVVDDPAQPALLVVGFPSQTIFEEAFFDSSAPSPKTPEQDPSPAPAHKPTPPDPNPDNGPKTPSNPGSVQFRLGGESRLVFKVPTDARIPYTVAGLLDWSTFELAVSPIADVPNGATPNTSLPIKEPEATETTLQLPFRLHLSPTHDAVWQHDPNLVNHAGRVELWHTRLATRDANGEAQQLSADNQIGLRAIWSPDYKPGGPVPSPGTSGLSPLPTIAPMDIADRHQIVVLTAAFDGYAANSYQRFVPTQIEATMLMLSPLGGWLRSAGVWDPPTKIRPRIRYVPIGVDHILKGRELEVAARLGIDQAGIDQIDGENPDVDVRPDVAVRRDVAQVAEPLVEAAAAPAAQRAFAIDAQKAFLDPERIALNIYDLDPDGKLDLSQWTHIAAQGRDHYVRLVYEGRLKDLGHRASLVKVTERRFEESPSGVPVAYLRQYMYVVVKEPEKYYPNEGLADEGRGMPLRRVRLTTLVTPHIDNPYDSPPAVTYRSSFWVMVNKQDFLFHGYAEDVAGNRIDFQKPLIFVPDSETDFTSIDDAIKSNRARISASIPGQKVTFAERLPDGDPAAGKDNTSLVAEAIYFENEGPSGDAFFKPRIFAADVHLPAVEALTGSTAITSIRLTKPYLAKGFGDAANKTGTFAEIVSHNAAVPGDLSTAWLGAAFRPAQAGGFSTPSLDIVCVTRSAGPLGGTIADAMSNTFDPKQVFKAGKATLFGAFDLADLLPGDGSVDDHAPKMQVHRQGTNVITDLDWQSPIPPPNPSRPAGIIDFVPVPNKTALKVHAVITKDLAGSAGTFALDGALNDFSIVFLASLEIKFTAFTFASRTGSKTDVNVHLDNDSPIVFEGDLSFVEGLRKIIPPGVFGDGVSIDLIQNPLGVKAGLSIGLPPAPVGVFALKNVAFSAGLTIPFLEGKPVVEFGFASRDKPFLLAVMIFGGGGFFHLELDTGGMRLLEAAFEFGAAAALDIGVASGEVHIMAGIYFKMEKKQLGPPNGEQMVSSLSGYLRCGGSLCVLGIVRVSVEFYLCFTYFFEQKAKGSATLTVEISIACFSKSIELTVERSFGGKGGDPAFVQSMDTPALWAEYADAFA
jgi:hypothetical protein